MTLNEIERALRELRLSGIADTDTLSTRVMQAQSTQEPFLETFAVMQQDKLGRRRSRLTERRFKHSRLDERPSRRDAVEIKNQAAVNKPSSYVKYL
ncbi:MAG: hypothetical protein ACYCSH_12525 [Acidithiobacillus sp.]